VTADRSTDQPAVRVSAFVAAFNHDGQEGTGLSTGLAPHREEFWDTAGFGPEEIDLACVYDDYPVMVLVQLSDLGLVEPGDERAFLNQRLGRDTWPLNPSGGQLSAGQAGAAGGMHGLVESVQHLLGHAGERQVVGARRALVTGYGMVLYRYGGCANAVALEAS
jgi:acetyl-CoA acetyltransferase